MSQVILKRCLRMAETLTPRESTMTALAVLQMAIYFLTKKDTPSYV